MHWFNTLTVPETTFTPREIICRIEKTPSSRPPGFHKFSIPSQAAHWLEEEGKEAPISSLRAAAMCHWADNHIVPCLASPNCFYIWKERLQVVLDKKIAPTHIRDRQRTEGGEKSNEAEAASNGLIWLGVLQRDLRRRCLRSVCEAEGFLSEPDSFPIGCAPQCSGRREWKGDGKCSQEGELGGGSLIWHPKEVFRVEEENRSFAI